MLLEGRTLAGDVFIFTSPDDEVSRVDFYIDGVFVKRENTAPFDLAGTDTGDPTRSALPYDTTQLSNGIHTVSTTLRTEFGEETATASFTVDNPGS